jgi:hypothetical protein
MKKFNEDMCIEANGFALFMAATFAGMCAVASGALNDGEFRNALDAAEGLVQSVGHDASGGTARPARYPPSDAAADCAQQLFALLQYLGASTAANHCVGQTDAATARATERIAGWLTYLPVHCVRTMVNDGWHWST